MKWVLVVLLFANWDGKVESHKQLAAFETKEDCEAERDRMEKRGANGPRRNGYICAGEYRGQK